MHNLPQTRLYRITCLKVHCLNVDPWALSKDTYVNKLCLSKIPDGLIDIFSVIDFKILYSRCIILYQGTGTK
jgi:hypothetical protein